MSNQNFTCHGCGQVVDAAAALAFRCPNAGKDDVDHLLLSSFTAGAFEKRQEQDPFLRYRNWLSPYQIARKAGLSDQAWEDIVGKLDQALIAVDGKGFRITPMTEQASLAKAAGIGSHLWVKDETGNVSGSHKARHLMGLMLYLHVLQTAKLPASQGLEKRRLAIASCGNAALAAAVIARAAQWALDVFIPPDASPAVVQQLKALGAEITLCERRPNEAGDPCFLRFQEAVKAGAIPFGVQGTENGLAIEGCRTLAFEMAETMAQAQCKLDSIYIQVGGGALASALAQGFALAAQTGLIDAAPKLFAVQTQGCAPLDRAWQALQKSSLEEAVKNRSQFMWPWEEVPHSIAHGILDDETYDWFEIVKAVQQTHGQTMVVPEPLVEQAWLLSKQHSSIKASATGTAGLAGMLLAPPQTGNVAVIFSGIDR